MGLLGISTPSEATWAAIGTAVGAVVTAGLAGLVTWMTARSKVKREERSDAIKEWREITDGLQLRIDKADAKIDAQASEMTHLQVEHAECMKENAELRGDIRLLQSSVQRLQGLAGDEAPATVLATVITADLTGKVLNASPSVAPLLHWLPQELTGRNVELLIPERLRDAHRAGLRKVAETGQPPWTERPVLAHALTKDGAEIPVAITLHGWQVAGGEWRISAEIKRRALTGKTTTDAKEGS